METKSPKRFTLLAFSLFLPWIALAGPDSAILFIGDGMGPAQVTAARIYQANARDGRLALDSIEQVAIVRTYSNDRRVTDSAAAAT
ncbi:alkaline phosphatase, partial [Candidatus Sumerlaeota bacterium]|nr:alkaline phosphatase [Candidatus Sumerlaeota bacterium]